MKRVLLINVVLLALLVYVWSSYNHRQAIINCGNPISNYSVIEVNCSSGYRGGSSILIKYNSKRYYVGIKPSQCKSFNPQNIKLFYDKKNDKVFEQSELTVRYIVFYSILYLGSCIWLCAIIRKRKK